MSRRPASFLIWSNIPHAILARYPRVAATILLSLAAAFAGQNCAFVSSRPPHPTIDVTGFWEGRLIDSCGARMARCGGAALMTLSMIQNESNISGVYRCSANSYMCRSVEARGKIAVGQIRGPGVSLRVMFEDVSSCIFNGTFSDSSGSGAYICMLGAGVARGFWYVKRAYGPLPPAG